MNIIVNRSMGMDFNTTVHLAVYSEYPYLTTLCGLDSTAVIWDGYADWRNMMSHIKANRPKKCCEKCANHPEFLMWLLGNT